MIFVHENNVRPVSAALQVLTEILVSISRKIGYKFKYVLHAYQRKCFIIIDLNVVATTCSVGFTGKYGENQCSYPHYGIGCKQNFSCSKGRCFFTGCQFTKTGIWLI